MCIHCTDANHWTLKISSLALIIFVVYVFFFSVIWVTQGIFPIGAGTGGNQLIWKNRPSNAFRTFWWSISRMSSYLNCRLWFQRFKSGKERPGRPKQFENNELQGLLNGNPAQIVKKKLSKRLTAGQSTVSIGLYAMKNIQKGGGGMTTIRMIESLSNQYQKDEKKL